VWVAVTIAYHLASRLAYVLWVGITLTRQRHHQTITGAMGVDAGFAWFRRRASLLMANDAASFVLLCVATRQYLPVGVPRALSWVAGGVLIIAGIGTKAWAARTLGRDAYYWHNFFGPEKPTALGSPGPYRYLDNPMYTVGYLQAYGLALAVGSLPGVAAALFDQVAILAFHRLVEHPHYQELVLTAASLALASPSAIP
jgi:protein-S-isoprenylcysteine O-methyltransferase Ste14